MKLLHIIAQKPEKTGSGIFVGSIIEEASKKQYQQALVAGISTQDEAVSIMENHNVSFFPVYFDSQDLPFPVVGMSDVMPYQSTKYCDMDPHKLDLWQAVFAKRIQEAIEVFMPDVIISHHLWLLSAIVCEFAASKSIPVACICHGTDLRQMELCPELSKFAKNGLHKVDRVLALNEYQVGKIEEYYSINADKIKVIGAAYNSSVFYMNCVSTNEQEITDKKAVRLIYAGKLSISKGVLSLIKAYDSLPFDNTMELLLAGSGAGEERKLIEKAAATCRNKVSLLGLVSQQQLSELFRGADIFVLPSFYEGLPLVVLEALASGLRVIVTQLPGLRQWLGEELFRTGVIDYIELPKMKTIDVPFGQELPGFEKRLQYSLQRRIDDVRQKRVLPKGKIKEIMQNNTWESMFERLEDILDELIKKSIK